MKIAIPLDENKIDICPTFGRSPYFYFEENGKEEIVQNPACEEQGGAGPKAAQFLADMQTDVLLTVRCGQNAADVLKLADIKIYKTQGKTAKENAEAFHQNKLEVLTHFHAGFQGIQ